MEPRAKIGSNLDTWKRGPPLLKIMFYEHREDLVGGGGWGEQAMPNTHPNSVPSDTLGGWSLRQ